MGQHCCKESGSGGEAVDYAKNGEDWTLAPNLENQSPIDIETAKAVDRSHELKIERAYSNLTNQNFTWSNFKLACEFEGGEFTLTEGEKSKKFVASSLQFHAASEHTLDGKRHSLELQIGHKFGEEWGVLSVLFDAEKDTENAFLAAVNPTNLTADKNERNLPLGDLFKELSNNYYGYFPGSQTAPPCAEGVNWFIVEEVQAMSKKQLEQFDALWKENKDFTGKGNGNYRVAQKLNNREVWKIAGAASEVVNEEKGQEEPVEHQAEEKKD